MNFFDAFKKLWGSAGTVDDGLSDAQYQAGWDYIGLTPPELGQFNKREKLIDEKIKWLYEQLETAAQQRGVSLSGADITSLAQLLALSDALPQIAGVASAGTANKPARDDHVHPTDNKPQIAPGFILPFAGDAAPAGWLKANGIAVSRTTYSALFGAISTKYGVGDGSTTFNLPDLRAEFIRGFDDGRGVDPGRVFGSLQGGQNQWHQHYGSTATSGEHSHAVSIPSKPNGTGAGPIAMVDGAWNITGHQTYNTSAAGNHTHTFTTSGDGGNEARPRNVAMLYCIKY